MIGRVDSGLEAVAAADAEPVGVEDPIGRLAGGTRPAPAAVVLQADVDVVRPAHVGAHPVGKRRGHRVDEVPRPALVPRDVQPAVIADDQMLRVLRIDPQRVLVDMTGGVVAAGVVECCERASTIERLRPGQAGGVDRLVVGRIDAQLAEVHRPRVAVAHVRPGRTLVLRPEDAAAARIERRRDLWRRRLPGWPGWPPPRPRPKPRPDRRCCTSRIRRGRRPPAAPRGRRSRRRAGLTALRLRRLRLRGGLRLRRHRRRLRHAGRRRRRFCRTSRIDTAASSAAGRPGLPRSARRRRWDSSVRRPARCGRRSRPGAPSRRSSSTSVRRRSTSTARCRDRRR